MVVCTVINVSLYSGVCIVKRNTYSIVNPARVNRQFLAKDTNILVGFEGDADRISLGEFHVF